MNKKVYATIEARLSASRLPGKVMYPIRGVPMLQFLIQRVRKALLVEDIIVATTTKPEDTVIVDLCKDIGCRYFRGSVEDITERLLGATQGEDVDIIVQLTGDNPFVDPAHIDAAVETFKKGDFDYVSNNLNNGLIIGFDVRCFSRKSLEKVAVLTNDPIDRVHGSYFIYRNPSLFKLGLVEMPQSLCRNDIRLTVDEPADYALIKEISERFEPSEDFSSQEIVALLDQEAKLKEINNQVQQKNVSIG